MTYSNWAQLAAANTLGVDYRLPVRDENSVTACLAIHGGAIEPGTSEVASDVAAASYQSYYSLEGIKASNNSDLFIASTNYDEPQLLALMGGIRFAFSFHGVNGTAGVAESFVSGLDSYNRDAVISSLTLAGFTASNATSEGDGNSFGNIVNKTTRSAGVQIEMSLQQRANFFSSGDLSQANRQTGLRTDEFYRYVHAIARVAGNLEYRSQQTLNYDLNKPKPTDQMSDFETWLNANWTKLTSVNKFAVNLRNTLPTTGNFQPGDRIINSQDNSPYICICNDPVWGIFWRPILAPISTWRSIGNGVLANLSYDLQNATRPFQCAIDNHGWIHWRGTITYTPGAIPKNSLQTPFLPLPDGIQPRQNESFLVGHSSLSVATPGAGTPDSEWEGVVIQVPHTVNGTNAITLTALGGLGVGTVNTVYVSGQLRWPIGSGVFNDAYS